MSLIKIIDSIFYSEMDLFILLLPRLSIGSEKLWVSNKMAGFLLWFVLPKNVVLGKANKTLWNVYLTWTFSRNFI